MYVIFIFYFSSHFHVKTFSALPLKIQGQNLNFETSMASTSQRYYWCYYTFEQSH